MIEVSGLSKHFGNKLAVDGLSFTAAPGQVTGFLGPNGAGKSTTMRMILGLDRPTAGEAKVNGRRYRDSPAPLAEVGALLDAKATHRGRSAESHLRSLAATHGISRKRVDEVIQLAGLEAVARKRVGGFSLGMGQRLGIAAAMLGDPQVLILDEPVNGLDPEGVRWVRDFAKALAAQGRTVFISSHLMSEMSQTADHLVVLGRGRLLMDAPIQEVLAGGRSSVLVRSPRATELAERLTAAGAGVTSGADGSLIVIGPTAAQVGETAAALGLPLHELTQQSSSLEEVYMDITKDSVEYQSADVPETEAER